MLITVARLRKRPTKWLPTDFSDETSKAFAGRFCRRRRPQSRTAAGWRYLGGLRFDLEPRKSQKNPGATVQSAPALKLLQRFQYFDMSSTVAVEVKEKP